MLLRLGGFYASPKEETVKAGRLANVEFKLVTKSADPCRCDGQGQNLCKEQASDVQSNKTSPFS